VPNLNFLFELDWQVQTDGQTNRQKDGRMDKRMKRRTNENQQLFPEAVEITENTLKNIA